MFSMMTVLNEHKNMKKYQYIVFVEFLEMICRIAIICITIQETIDFKVNMLLKMIYEDRYTTKKWLIDKWPLINSDDIDDREYKIV